jgi:hypothetical protein
MSAMVHRLIGQERLGFAAEAREAPSLDRLLTLIDWTEVTDVLGDIHVSARGEPAWPPLAMFKALLLSIWYDLSDVKLARRWTTGVHSDGSVASRRRRRHPSVRPLCATVQR